ncbi:MAG: hypothetical protein AABX01_01685 [Candidatus Micrarchaeota archaeon]
MDTIIVPPPSPPQITNLQITTTNQSAQFHYFTKKQDGSTPFDNTLNIFRLGILPSSLPVVYTQSFSNAEAIYLNDSLTNNTVYYYNITSCDLNNLDICSSVTGSFQTDQTNLTATPTPTPVPTTGVSPSPPVAIYRLRATIQNAGGSGSNLVSEGSVLLAAITVENKGNRPTIVTVYAKERAASATSYRRITNAFFDRENSGLTLQPGDKITFTATIPTDGWVNGSHEILPDLVITGLASNIDLGSALFIQITQKVSPPLVYPDTIISTPSGTTSKIAWETDIPSSSRIDFGIDGFGKFQEIKTSSAQHTITLSPLEKGKIYRFKITSFGAGGTSSVYPSTGYLTFQTLADDSRFCDSSNYCTGAKFFKMQAVNGECKILNPAGEICKATGCFTASCDVSQGGCIGVPDNSFCKESCSPEGLRVDANCVQGTSTTDGKCIYAELKCDKLNLCDTIQNPFVCRGKNHYCIRQGEKFLWSLDDTFCKTGSSTGIDQGPDKPPIKIEYNKTDNETIEIPAGGRGNEISPLGYLTEPEIIRETDNVDVYVQTNSKSDIIGQPICEHPEGSGYCNCEPGYLGSKGNFKCEMQPLAKGEYFITLKNAEGQSGKISVILENGKPAQVSKVFVPDTERNVIFILLLAISVFVIALTGGSIIYKKRKDRLYGPRLENYLAYTVPHYKEELNLKFMKGLIKEQEFKEETKRLEENKTLTEARLREWYKKHPKKERINLGGGESGQGFGGSGSGSERVGGAKGQLGSETGNASATNYSEEPDISKIIERKRAQELTEGKTELQGFELLGEQKKSGIQKPQAIDETPLHELPKAPPADYSNPDLDKLIDALKKKKQDDGQN